LGGRFRKRTVAVVQESEAFVERSGVGIRLADKQDQSDRTVDCKHEFLDRPQNLEGERLSAVAQGIRTLSKAVGDAKGVDRQIPGLVDVAQSGVRIPLARTESLSLDNRSGIQLTRYPVEKIL